MLMEDDLEHKHKGEYILFPFPSIFKFAPDWSAEYFLFQPVELGHFPLWWLYVWTTYYQNAFLSLTEAFLPVIEKNVCSVQYTYNVAWCML